MKEEFVPISLIAFLRTKWLYLIAPLGFSLIAFCLSFEINFLLTALLTPNAYGDASLVLAWLSILGSVIVLGLDQTSLRFLSGYIDTQNETRLYQFMAWGLNHIKWPMFGTCALGMALIVSQYYLYPNQSQGLLIPCLLLATPLLGLSNWFASLLLAYRKTSHATFIQYLAFPLTLVIILASCYAMHVTTLSVTSIYCIYIIALLIIFGISLSYCNKRIPSFKAMLIQRKTQGDVSIQSQWIDCACRQAGSMLIYNLVVNLDLLIMGVAGNHTDTLGHYTLAVAISDIIWLIPQSLFQYLRSEVEGSLKSSSQTETLQKMWDKTFAFNAILSIVITGLILVNIDTILALFGPEYAPTKPLLQVLVVGNFLAALLGCPSIALRYTGHVNKLVYINFATAIIMVALSMTFIPVFGLIGVGYACILANILQALAENMCAFKYTQIKPLTWV